MQSQPNFGPRSNPPSTTPVQPSWWGRNWKWVVPVGCLTPVVLCSGFIALIVFSVMGMLKSSDVYTEAVAAARANDEVKTLIGEPISEGAMPTGSININGSTGQADLSIALSGPKGSATLNAKATRAEGQWTFSKLEVVPSGNGKRIDLRSQTESEK